MKHDPNYIASLEKAIKEKYGDDAISNPKSGWDDDKEEEYLKQLKKMSQKDRDSYYKKEVVDNSVAVYTNCDFCKSYIHHLLEHRRSLFQNFDLFG